MADGQAVSGWFQQGFIKIVLLEAMKHGETVPILHNFWWLGNWKTCKQFCKVTISVD